MMHRLFPVLFAIALFPPSGTAEPLHRLPYSDWAVPRDAQALLSMSGVAEAVRELIRRPNGRLQIHYPGGEQGVLWAHELRGWLVALGVESVRIELVPGGPGPQVIGLRVVPGPGRASGAGELATSTSGGRE